MQAPSGAPPPHGGGHGKHGNPADLERYIARMEDPARDAWQKPDDVVKALKLKAGQTACDVGAGPGYFTLRLARTLGPAGHVFAVDVEPRMLEVLRARMAKGGVRNVSPVLAMEDDPLLPLASCDLVLVVDTYHHFPDGVAYLRKLRALLKPGGRLVNIDFHKKPLPVGPPPEVKVSRETFLETARSAGLSLVEEPQILPHQYFLVLEPK